METVGDLSLGEKFVQNLDAVINNLITSRSEFFSTFFDRGHKVEDECGYPPIEELTPTYYRSLFDRDPIAARAVELMPKESWQGSPTVRDKASKKGDDSTRTQFDKDWAEVVNSTSTTTKSWHAEEKGSPVWEHLQRLDTVSRIGKFGVMLIGYDDGRNLQDPVDGVEVVANSRVNGIECIEAVPDSPPTEEDIANAKQPVQLRDWVDGEWKVVGEVVPTELPAHNSGWDVDREAKVLTDRGWLVVNRKTGALKSSGGVPSVGPFVQAPDRQYSQGYGMGMPAPGADAPQASLAGTDQQYFGVQFGPSETFSDKPSKKKRKVLFLRCFDESLVQVVRYEWNIRNPRFGLPVMYRITLNDPRQPHSGVGLPLATVYVHWSRVIHVAENLFSSELFAIPTLQQILAPVLDARKVRGASAEGYWQSCFTALSLETNPQLGGDAIVDQASIANMMRMFKERLQRWLVFIGMSAKTLAPTVVDPTPHKDQQIEAICIRLGCPVRVFKGSERGELASSQDDEAWNKRKQERRETYITPRIICQFVDRLIQTGVCAEPEEGYVVEWPDVDALSKKDRTAIAFQVAQTMALYVSGGLEQLLPEELFFTEVLGWTNEVATDIAEQAQEAQDDREEELQDDTQEGDTDGEGQEQEQEQEQFS